jgi:hypothetical protein
MGKVMALVGEEADVKELVRDLSARFGEWSPTSLDSPAALALLFDANLSQRGYGALRRYLGDKIPPHSAYREVMKELRIELKELKDDDGNRVGYAVQDPVNSCIKPHLVAFLQRNEAVAETMRDSGAPYVVEYKHGSDSFSITKFDKTSFPSEQSLLTLLLPDRLANCWRHSIPLAFVMHRKETPELMKTVNDFVDPLLPRGDARFVTVTLPGDEFVFTFELQEFRSGDAKAVAAELGSQGVQSTFNCFHCTERFGPHGTCLRRNRAFGPCFPLRAYEDLVKWGTTSLPFTTWANAHPVAVQATQKQLKEDPTLVAARAAWSALVQERCTAEPDLAQALEVPHSTWYKKFDMAKLGNRTIADELAHIRQACYSMQMPPSALTALECCAMDVLHYTINTLSDLLQWAHDAAKQCTRLARAEAEEEGVEFKEDFEAELVAAYELVAGKKPLMGYEGISARKLMEDWRYWTAPLSEHPLWSEMQTIFGGLARMVRTLWSAFGKDDHQVIKDFNSDMGLVLDTTISYFAAPGKMCAAECSCKDTVRNANPAPREKGKGKGTSDHTWMMRKVRRGGVEEEVYFPVFKHGFYAHMVYRHVVGFMSKYGGPMKYSSIVLEHANAVWKDIILHRIAHGKRAGQNDQTYCALTRFLLMTNPVVEKASKKRKPRPKGRPGKRKAPAVEG